MLQAQHRFQAHVRRTLAGVLYRTTDPHLRRTLAHRLRHTQQELSIQSMAEIGYALGIELLLDWRPIPLGRLQPITRPSSTLHRRLS